MRDFWFVVGALCMVAAFGVSFLRISRRSQRRIYWTSAGLLVLTGAMIGYPDPKSSIEIPLMLLALMTFAAYVATPYLKIGSKIYAMYLSDRQPDPQDRSPSGHDKHSEHETVDQTSTPPDPHPDSYGGIVTAATLWWGLVVLAGVAAGNTYAYLFSNGQAPPATVGTCFIALLAIAGGYGDASWGYPIARRQYLPFGVVSVITAGAFALVYLAAYYTARRLPARNKHSLEYRAHPRHHHRQP